jgi:membrane carboxypeptidase/penicillin-binding protein PbpC
MRRQHPHERVIATTIDATAQRALENASAAGSRVCPTPAAALVIDNVARCGVSARPNSPWRGSPCRHGRGTALARFDLKPFLYALALDEA